MRTRFPLPIDDTFESPENYVDSLLASITSCELFQTLCGGIHILDFLTTEPDLYSTLLPQDWRDWFQLYETSEILYLLMRENDNVLESLVRSSHQSLPGEPEAASRWTKTGCPPPSLAHYIQVVRKHALNRKWKPHNESEQVARLPRHVAVGMKPKKIHEVENFVHHIGALVADINESNPQNITHVVDFGSGQNYLGRALASSPHNMDVVALESKQLNIAGAKAMDVTAKIAEKEKILRNKKHFRMGRQSLNEGRETNGRPLDQIYSSKEESKFDHGSDLLEANGRVGKIKYVEKFIENGDLSKVISSLTPQSTQVVPTSSIPQLLVISLHSCGNLIHHGLRSLVDNPSVKAVAMIGCCYNLVTERLGPRTYKLPSLRLPNHRLSQTSSACDAHGYPMSEHFAAYKHQHGTGVRFNITARMMACQAPQNWTTHDCDVFFTRHFYRALLQRILLDHGIVQKLVVVENDVVYESPCGWTDPGPPLIIGSLPKACHTSFKAYVRGALTKLAEDQYRGTQVRRLTADLTDSEIEAYEDRYEGKKKEIGLVWSLMAFSATVVESAIVVDRWLYLKEQPEVDKCWVETVFDYKQSPRNLVIVGVKK
ncbi:hypothetical protein MMC21_007709 [Puttea exsequens]|nr:hypothetical protein [Puttea exsequens]